MGGKYHRIFVGRDENGKRIFIDEHRLIMEQFLGRKLKENEVVHHINGNKNDNRIENLQVMTDREHRRLHLKDSLLSKTAIEKRKQASSHRAINSRRKINDNELINMIEDYKLGMSYRAVDRKYKLSNGTFGNIMRGIIYYNKQTLIKEILNK